MSTGRTIEDTKKALRLCQYDPDPGQECKMLVACDICPYWSDERGCEQVELLKDALNAVELVETLSAALDALTGGECADCKVGPDKGGETGE